VKNCIVVLFFFSFCLPAFSTNEVIYIWAGGVTPFSVNVNAKLTDTSSTVRLTLSTSPQFSQPIYSSYYSVDTNTHMMVAMSISGLAPSTKYFYAVESGGILDSSSDDVGNFTTFTAGYFSYYFVTGSCCLNSNHVVYDIMRNCHPLFYSCMGDLHYGNPNSATNINIHRDAYENLVLSKPRAAAFFKEVPIEYVWDDHDFAGNNSDSSFVGKANARQAYREYVPHYPLPAGNGNAAIYQSFTIGRVHFIHTDLRSDRYGNSMMGAQQKAWFENECIAARDSNQIIAWISSTTWNGNNTDNWGGYTAERAELANFFRDNLIMNMFIICGDAHMLAIDDGSNADFSTPFHGTAQYPIFAAAALNQGGSYKGGTFSEGGCFLNPTPYHGQFGVVEVLDTGGTSICIRFSGFCTDSAADIITMVNQYEFCRDLGPAPNGNFEIPRNSNDVFIYPNPSSGKFVFETEEQLLNPIVMVTDVAGKIVEPKFSINDSGTDITFDFETFPSGIYFVKIISKNQAFEKKVVISR
jgi:hypothetical protein